MIPADWKQIKYFKPAEFPKNPNAMVLDAVQALDQLREISGTPIQIHVGWDNAGHASKSYHYRGLAIDFHFCQHTDYAQQLRWIEEVPDFGGIGFYPDWRPHAGWHVDLRPKNNGARLYWVGQLITKRDPKTKNLVKEQVYTYDKGMLLKLL